MDQKKSVDDLINSSQEWASWQDHLCKSCKDMIVKKMKPIQRGYNQGGLKKRWAEVKMTKLTATLWTCLCHKCLRKIKQKAMGGKQ